MTITVTDIVTVPVIATGASQVLAFEFKALTEAEVEVVTVAGGAESILDDDYYVVSLDRVLGVVVEGGSVTLDAGAVVAGTTVYLRAAPLFDQAQVFELGNFRAPSLNEMADRSVLRDLRLAYMLSAAIAGSTPLNVAHVNLDNATVVSPLFPLAEPVPVLKLLTSTLRVSLLGTPGPNNDYSALVSAAAPLLQFRTLVIDVPEIRLNVTFTGRTNIHITGDGESQRTIRLFGGGLEFASCDSCEIDNVAVLPATGYNGPGLDWTGTSSNNDVHDIFIQGFTQEGNRFVGTAPGLQSGNKLRNVSILDCGDATHASYVFEWSQDSETTGIQCGSAVKGINQYNGRYTFCRQGLIEGGKNWNAKTAVFFDRVGKFKLNGARYEESQNEVAKFFQCDRMNIGESHFHTASEAATGVSDCVLLDGSAYITFANSAADSFNAINSRHAFNAINGCVDLKLVGCSSENYTGNPVNGTGWTVIGHSPRTSNTVTIQEFVLQAENVAVGTPVFATPTGKRTSVGDAGLRFTVDTVVTAFSITAGATPGASQSYGYELLANNVAIASGTIPAGQSTLDVTGLFAVPARQLINVRITPSGGAAVTSHIGSVTVAR